MEELLRTIKSTMGLLLLLVTGRILYDLLRESWHSKSLQHWGLIGVFIAFVSNAMMILVQSYSMELPMWLHFWHIINLALPAVALYHMLTELSGEDHD